MKRIMNVCEVREVCQGRAKCRCLPLWESKYRIGNIKYIDTYIKVKLNHFFFLNGGRKNKSWVLDPRKTKDGACMANPFTTMAKISHILASRLPTFRSQKYNVCRRYDTQYLNKLV